MSGDLDILVKAITEILPIWDESRKSKTLITEYPPDDAVLKPIALAIEKCTAYQAVNGQSLFSGYSGVVIHSHSLAIKLLYRADWPRENPDTVKNAASWLLRILQTKRADGLFVAPIWGLEVREKVDLGDGATLCSFDAVPENYTKKRLIERSAKAWDGSVWISQRFFDRPGAAIVRQVRELPYIGEPNPPFERIGDLEIKTKELVEFLQACVTGTPLVAGSWFEYEDGELDINAVENHVIWYLPEVVPHVRSNVTADVTALTKLHSGFRKLPTELRNRLSRALERFVLSQSRQKTIDQVLDLTLAFEIAVSGGKSDNAPASWKVAVRSAQLIGGTLENRSTTRASVGKLYALRSAATHGGNLNEAEKNDQTEIISAARKIYERLVVSFVELGSAPNWPALELQARVSS